MTAFALLGKVPRGGDGALRPRTSRFDKRGHPPRPGAGQKRQGRGPWKIRWARFARDPRSEASPSDHELAQCGGPRAARWAVRPIPLGRRCPKCP